MTNNKTNLGYNMFFVGLAASRIKNIEIGRAYGEGFVKVVYHPSPTRAQCSYGESYVRERYGWQRIGCSSTSTRKDGCHVEIVGIS